MKVLALTRYPRRGSSSRLRLLQYLPSLAAAGLDVTVRELWPEAHLDDLYAGRRSPAHRVLARYAARALDLLRAREFDLVWIEAELFPYLPSVAELVLASLRTPFVLDLDDAVFHKYDDHERAMVRAVLGEKLDRVMRRAALVVAGNEYIAAHARGAGAPRVELLPTVVDLDRYPTATSRTNEPPRVVWIGTSHNAHYLDAVASPLAGLVRDRVLSVHLVGAGAAARGFPFEDVEWSESTEVESLRECDVGIMPLPDTPFERGKCGYKLIQYMACGLPVVASPVGVNRALVTDGENGFLASSPDEWREALARLAGDASLRARLGRAGRSVVEERYSLDVTAPRLVELLRSVG